MYLLSLIVSTINSGCWVYFILAHYSGIDVGKDAMGNDIIFTFLLLLLLISFVLRMFGNSKRFRNWIDLLLYLFATLGILFRLGEVFGIFYLLSFAVAVTLLFAESKQEIVTALKSGKSK
jgi:hypothetical protein